MFAFRFEKEVVSLPDKLRSEDDWHQKGIAVLEI